MSSIPTYSGRGEKTFLPDLHPKDIDPTVAYFCLFPGFVLSTFEPLHAHIWAGREKEIVASEAVWLIKTITEYPTADVMIMVQTFFS